MCGKNHNKNPSNTESIVLVYNKMHRGEHDFSQTNRFFIAVLFSRSSFATRRNSCVVSRINIFLLQFECSIHTRCGYCS